MKANKVPSWVEDTVKKYDIKPFKEKTPEESQKSMDNVSKYLLKKHPNKENVEKKAEEKDETTPIAQPAPKTEPLKKEYSTTYTDFVRWLTDVKQYQNPIMIETAVAYADCFRDLPNREWQNLRNLDWGGRKVDAEVLRLQTKIVGGYNEFNNNVCLKVTEFFGKGHEIQYRLGREGSVVIYVTGASKENEQKALELFKQDQFFEADEVGVEPNGDLRIWWD